MYDIIGDVHGHYTLLKKLLKTLGYEKKSAGYHHPERKPVFVGDFISRGPEIRQTIKLIRKMTEGKTVVIIEHDMDVVFSLADRITVLHYGKILATGKPDDIRCNQDVKDAYLGDLEVCKEKS